jgi:multidrug resistance efflux pump
VEELNFKEGDLVPRGFVLARLEHVDYQADRDHCRAAMESAFQHWQELKNGSRPQEIEAARAELDESKAQREQLYLDWKRSSGLQLGTALAARDYEQAYGSYKAMDRRVERLRQALKLMEEGPRKERIQAAKADYELAKADLDKARWRLDSCTVTAPIGGTILTKKAEKGDIVNPAALSISASLCEMADLSDVEVEMFIQERDVARVFRGQRCQVRAEAYADRVYEGQVSRLMPIADRGKGAVPVRVKVTVPKGEEGVYLKPEMGAVVWFFKK